MNFQQLKEYLTENNIKHETSFDLVYIFKAEISRVTVAAIGGFFSYYYDRIEIDSTGLAEFYDDDGVVFCIRLEQKTPEVLQKQSAEVLQLKSDLDRADKIIDNLCELIAKLRG